MPTSQRVTAQIKQYDEDNNVKLNAEGKPVKVQVRANFPMPENLDEAIEMWGENAVFYHAVASARVQAQNLLRANKDKSESELERIADSWKPTEGRPRGASKERKAFKLLADMSEEEREEFIAKLQSGKFDSDDEDEDDE